MKRRTAELILAALLFLVGILLLLYPELHRLQSEIAMDATMDRFPVPTATSPANMVAEPDNSMPEEPVRAYGELWDTMTAYNEEIFLSCQDRLDRVSAYRNSRISPLDYGLEEETIGIIHIPAMEQDLPIYLGASPEHLSKGACVLGETSMPIGGENTNCVIAAHRGWYGALYFRHIELLDIGDEITIDNLWETLRYRVVEIQVIEPEDISAILIQPGRDLVTLITCHPYGSGGRYRILVFCERVPESNSQ